MVPRSASHIAGRGRNPLPGYSVGRKLTALDGSPTGPPGWTITRGGPTRLRKRRFPDGRLILRAGTKATSGLFVDKPTLATSPPPNPSHLAARRTANESGRAYQPAPGQGRKPCAVAATKVLMLPKRNLHMVGPPVATRILDALV